MKLLIIHNNGIASTFTVRRIGANGIGVERIYPYYSPNISEITFVKRGRVRGQNWVTYVIVLAVQAEFRRLVISKEETAQIKGAGTTKAVEAFAENPKANE